MAGNANPPNNMGGDRAASRPGSMSRSPMPISQPNDTKSSRAGNPSGYGRQASTVERNAMIPSATKGTADNRGNVPTGTPPTVDTEGTPPAAISGMGRAR